MSKTQAVTRIAQGNAAVVVLWAGAAALCGTLFGQTATVKSPILPAEPYNYTAVTLPAHFGGRGGVLGTDSTPATNPSTNAGVTLGRVLFYDVNLSRNRTKACASCHIQDHGFGDSATRSSGFAGGLTRRHSMGLSNTRFNPNGRVFWDERAASLEAQALMPIQDLTEMGMTLPELEQRVAELSYYPSLFQAAFGDTTVTSDRIAKAIAQFDRSILSYRSKYDIGRALAPNEDAPFGNFTAQENRGKTIFNNPPGQGGMGCAGCHRTEAFLDTQGPLNNGLDVDNPSDEGAFEQTGNPGQKGAFRFPSLRDIAARAPYMHDGRFATLRDVVEFYDHGVQPSPNLDPRLRNPGGTPVHFNFSSDDKAALVAFLQTLTDPVLLASPQLSDPFKATRSLNAASVTVEQSAPNAAVAAVAWDLADREEYAAQPLPTTLADLQVLVIGSDGVERAAKLLYAGPRQVNYVVPSGTSVGLASITVTKKGAVVSRGTLQINAVSPGIFTANGNGAGVPASYATSRNAAGQLQYVPVFTSSASGFVASKISLNGSDAVVELYGTGIRSGSGSISAQANGVPLEVLYAGAHPNYEGLDQMNVKIPLSMAGKGTVSLTLTVLGVQSNTVQLAF
jgi:cytochrome c peroxidase